MSAVARQRLLRTSVRSAPRSAPKKSLRLVAPVANRARRTPFVVVLLGMIGAGLVGLIMLSTYMQAQAFEFQQLTQEARDLHTEQAALEREVSEMESPRNLGARALIYGMVPSQTPVYLRLSDGKVIGRPEPAEASTNLKRVIR
jgi:cell division protein FtsB